MLERRSCSGQSSAAVYIGYYEGWNPQHPCDVVLPEDINVFPWTVGHSSLIVAFGPLPVSSGPTKSMLKAFLASILQLRWHLNI